MFVRKERTKKDLVTHVYIVHKRVVTKKYEKQGIITPPTIAYKGYIIFESKYNLHLRFMKPTHILCIHKVFQLF